MITRLKQYETIAYPIFRIMVGLLFLQHGLMKVFGLLGGNQASGLMLFVGIIELLAGLGIATGLLARLSALGGGIIMIAAYFKAHAPGDGEWFPVETGGELALLFLACFILILFYGAGRFALNNVLPEKFRW